MIDYEIYKMIHLFMIVLLFSSFAVQCYSEKKYKIHAILAGVATVFIFVSGMGLLARLGMPHAEPWPLWTNLKVVFWAFISILTPIIVKRAPQHKKKWFWVIMGTFVIITYVIIYKPV